MCVEYNCWKLSPAFRKIIRLEKPCMNVFPGFSQVQDPRGIITGFLKLMFNATLLIPVILYLRLLTQSAS